MNFHKFFNFHAVLRQFLKISGILTISGNFVAFQSHACLISFYKGGGHTGVVQIVLVKLYVIT